MCKIKQPIRSCCETIAIHPIIWIFIALTIIMFIAGVHEIKQAVDETDKYERISVHQQCNFVEKEEIAIKNKTYIRYHLLSYDDRYGRLVYYAYVKIGESQLNPKLNFSVPHYEEKCYFYKKSGLQMLLLKRPPYKDKSDTITKWIFIMFMFVVCWAMCIFSTIVAICEAIEKKNKSAQMSELSIRIYDENDNETHRPYEMHEPHEIL